MNQNHSHSQSQNMNNSVAQGDDEMNGQEQRIYTEIPETDQDSIIPKNRNQNFNNQLGWSNNFYGAMNSQIIQPEQQAVVVQKRKRNI